MQRVLQQPGLTREERNEKLRALYRGRQRALSQLLSQRNIEAVRQRFDQKGGPGSGLSLAEFVNVMDQCIVRFCDHRVGILSK